VDKELQKKERCSTARARWLLKKVQEEATIKVKTALLAFFKNVVELAEALQLRRAICGAAMLELR
jgi:hypothetical protein